MFPFSVHDQLPQSKLSGLLVAFAQGVWGQLDDGSEGFVFPEETNSFTWAHDQGYLETEHGVTEEALMDCIEQIEQQLGNPDQVRSQFGLLKGAGQAYLGLVVTSRLDPRLVCSYTPTSNYQSPVEAYFEWFLKNQSGDTIGTDDDNFMANFDAIAGVQEPAEHDLEPELPDYEEACHRLHHLTISEGRKQNFLQRLWDFNKTIAPGYRDAVHEELLREWQDMTQVDDLLTADDLKEVTEGLADVWGKKKKAKRKGRK